MNQWQLQSAKYQFSEVVQLALNTGPQFITLRGKPAVVVISQVSYEKLLEEASKKKNI